MRLGDAEQCLERLRQSSDFSDALANNRVHDVKKIVQRELKGSDDHFINSVVERALAASPSRSRSPLNTKELAVSRRVATALTEAPSQDHPAQPRINPQFAWTAPQEPAAGSSETERSVSGGALTQRAILGELQKHAERRGGELPEAFELGRTPLAVSKALSYARRHVLAALYAAPVRDTANEVRRSLEARDEQLPLHFSAPPQLRKTKPEECSAHSSALQPYREALQQGKFVQHAWYVQSDFVPDPNEPEAGRPHGAFGIWGVNRATVGPGYGEPLAHARVSTARTIMHHAYKNAHHLEQSEGHQWAAGRLNRSAPAQALCEAITSMAHGLSLLLQQTARDEDGHALTLDEVLMRLENSPQAVLNLLWAPLGLVGPLDLLGYSPPDGVTFNERGESVLPASLRELFEHVRKEREWRSAETLHHPYIAGLGANPEYRTETRLGCPMAVKAPRLNAEGELEGTEASPAEHLITAFIASLRQTVQTNAKA
jgi:hypothetical protein